MSESRTIGRAATLGLGRWIAMLKLLPEGSSLSNRVAASANAIRIMNRLYQALHQMEDILEAEVILLEDGSWVSVKDSRAVLPGAAGSAGTPAAVHRGLADDQEIRTILEELGVSSSEDPLPGLVRTVARPENIGRWESWKSFWHDLDRLDPSPPRGRMAHCFEEVKLSPENTLVPNMRGEWVQAHTVLRAGRIITPDSGGADDVWTIDKDFAAKHFDLLLELGITDEPRSNGGVFPWSDEYVAHVKSQGALTKARAERHRPGGTNWPTHLVLLEKAGAETRARLSKWLLSNFSGPPAISLSEEISCDSAVLWAIRVHGLVPALNGETCAWTNALHPSRSDVQRLFNVADLSDTEADLLGLSRELDSLSEDMKLEGLNRLADESDPVLIGRVLVELCSSVDTPERIPAFVGETVELRSPADVTVVVGDTEFKNHKTLREPVVVVGSDQSCNSLRGEWGLRGSQVKWAVRKLEGDRDSEAVIRQEFRGLEGLDRQIRCRKVVYREKLTLDLWIHDMGAQSRDVPSAIEDDVLYLEIRSDRDDANYNRDKLRLIDSALGLGLSSKEFDDLLLEKANNDVLELKKKCRKRAQEAGQDADGRAVAVLTTLFTVEELRTFLSDRLIAQIGEDSKDAETVARLALAVWGPDVLSQPSPKSIMATKGLDVPSTWAGSSRAKGFVRELGLGAEYGGFPSDDRERDVLVSPPSQSFPLHAEYQVGVYEKMKNFLVSNPHDAIRGWRSLLYMPTGAGKTRVTVQALLDVLTSDGLNVPRILWIADKDELCEQAVQTFIEVWRSSGKGGNLVVSRLWTFKNECGPAEFEGDVVAQVVVATYQKLVNKISGNDWVENYLWLRESGAVVVDEAHGAKGSAYTRIFRAMGLKTSHRSDEPLPLLGLTATPKNSIKNRFGGDAGLISIPEERVFEFLSGIGVLARPKFVDPIDGAEVVVETNVVEDTGGPDRRPVWLPKEEEEKLELDTERNRRIVDHIENVLKQSDPDAVDKPLILVFAISVPHAQMLAALLKMRGIEAAAVSSETPRGQRRHFVNEFRHGRVRVLTNYGVLTQGFDNPKVNVVYVTRPVFSDAAYLQMVGRGLRGPKNGGTEECTIVNIADNVEFMNLPLVYAKVNEWLSKPDDSDLDDDDDD